MHTDHQTNSDLPIRVQLRYCDGRSESWPWEDDESADRYVSAMSQRADVLSATIHGRA